MKFIQRLGYYLGGFAVGLIILAYFLSGKNASCDYGPNARTVKNIASKSLVYSEEVEAFVNTNNLDSTTVRNLIKYGNVDFSKSDTSLDSCKLYHINNSYKNKELYLKISNCEFRAVINNIKFNNE
ncbi:hypothetical protein [uncultured Winogradskyella sp.]|uniref:hypothetical protein n=1 Tax=uncultured Winogradskyella sp. TaxID=395353 RepID=UPI003513B4F3